jgi:hypothetical protein
MLCESRLGKGWRRIMIRFLIRDSAVKLRNLGFPAGAEPNFV